MTAEAPAAEWQRGFDLEWLKEVAGLFKQHDEGLILGAFTGVNELAVADWHASGRLLLEGGAEPGLPPIAALAHQSVRQRKPVKDFSGAVRCYAEPGDVWVRRIAYRPGEEGSAAELLEGLHPPQAETLFGEAGRLWAEAFIEHAGDMALLAALGFSHVCTKIPASSELIGVFCRPRPPEVSPQLAAEAEGLCRLPLSFEPGPPLAELDALSLSFEQHYSSKNKRGSWQALALRGYGPLGSEPDPGFIAKPAEMSKKWKRENEEKLSWELSDTPLRPQLPSLEPLLAQIPGRHHRVRLMRLAPGGGELARHADITDPDAGMEDGKLVRVHLPLRTSPQVRFECWLLDGQRQEASMAAGEAWVLDTRKPHTAVNGGSEERIHLVCDVESSPELRALIAAGSRP